VIRFACRFRFGLVKGRRQDSAGDEIGARLWLQTQPQQLEMPNALRLVLRTQPRSSGSPKLHLTMPVR